ncbi:hypothetical protein DFH06DRAFT_1208767 [Mycena polygramma]|nr:hypothetical protein DFH06DRAFT_1208767 [Mycena polygramma]
MTTIAAPPLEDSAQRAHIRELLRSHLPPPAYLTSTVSALTAELVRRDTQITRLREQLDQLLAERAVVQTHYTECNSVFAPIRRLPSEILAEIFGFCCDSFTPFIEELDSEYVSLRTEMARLAHEPLLTLSRVCARWHHIALGTPALWRRIEVDEILWTAPTRLEGNMELLQAALERSDDHPLTVAVANVRETPPHLPTFELVAQHSARWREATFICSFADIARFTQLKGTLLHLEALYLYCWGSEAVNALEILHDMPRLRFLDLDGSGHDIGVFSSLPWEQLTEARVGETLEEEVPLLATMVMPRLSCGTRLVLRLFLELQQQGLLLAENHFPFSGPYTPSQIAALTIEMANFVPIGAQQAAEMLLTQITLPCLTELAFDIPVGSLPIPWPHSPFLSLSQRSSFSTHLQNLYLFHTTISEAELLQALAVLPVLKRLSISDHLEIPLQNSVEHLLITDTLLGALTCKPNSEAPCLIPNLIFLSCRSMMRFDDTVYFNCLLSRLHWQPGSSPFQAKLVPLRGHGRELNTKVSARIHELRITGELVFWFEERSSNFP